MSDEKKWGLPENAKKVFEGVIWDVWQWEQEMFDGSVRTFERGVRKPGVAVIATKGDKILVIDEEQPGKEKFVSVPGGCADTWEETTLDVGKRELLEETGMKSEKWEQLQRVVLKGKTWWEIETWVARDCEKVQEAELESGERIEEKWVSFEEWLELAKREDWRNLTLVPLMLGALLDEGKREKLRVKIFGG